MVWGLKVVNVNIGGLSSFEAKAVLEKETAKIYQKDVILEYSKEDRTWQVTVLDMGFNIDIDNTINNALKIGREGVFKSFSEQASALFFGKNLPLSFNFNSKEFDDFGKINFFEIENYKQEPELKYDVSSSDFIIQPGKTGLMVDKEKLKDDILSQINQGFFSKVELALKKDQPLSQMAAEKTRQKALLILNSAPYYLTDQDKKWPLNKETILSWFFFLAKDDNLVIELKEKEVQSLLEGLVPEVNQPSTNAVLGQKDGQMIIVKEGQNKKELDLKSSFESIQREILNDNHIVNKEIALQIKTAPPEVNSNSIQELGFTSFLGQGSADYSGSPSGRIFNIKLGASRISGIIVRPNEEFSFNQTIGDINATSGYMQAIVLKNNKKVVEYGGGVCQVSTTLFRAAINAGLKIVERHAHAIPIAYYVPTGFDATVYPGQVDLRFLNDTKNNIYIQSYTKASKLYFEIYGSNDGREIKILGPKVLAVKEDGSMKTLLTQEVYILGKLLRRDQFYSIYKSPASYTLEENPLD